MTLQLSLVAPPSDWRPPSLSALPRWEDQPRVGFDVEARDEQLKKLGPGVRRRNCYPVGFSFAFEDGRSWYLPVRHAGGDNLPEERVYDYLRDQLGEFRGEIVGANFGYDLDWLLQRGLRPRPSAYRDVLVAEPLLDELQDSYALGEVAARHGLPGKEEEALLDAARSHGVDPKGGLWRLPARYVGPYAERDASLPLELLRIQSKLLEAEDLGEVWDLESRLLPALVDVRRRGVRVNWARVDEVEQFSLAEETRCLDEVKRLTGVRVKVGDVWKAKALAPVLYEIGITPDRTPKTGAPKIDDALLESIHHDAAAALRRARKVNKVRTTFVESIRDHAVGDRIHCTFNQLRFTDERGEKQGGGRFGRISCSNPNLQQQPGRDPELGPLWRSIYVPEPDEVWALLDYSQQEPRWVTHYAEAIGCTGAAQAAERYRRDPKTDNHTMMTHLVHGESSWERWDKKTRKKHRGNCKQIYLGLCYGMGGGKLCRDLGLPTEWIQSRRTGKMIEVAGPEGRAILDLFNQKAPFLRELADRVSAKAAQAGFIRTISGRKCRFPKDDQGNFDWTHKGLNRLIQGTSADQTKRAVVLCYEEVLPLLLQVHDEIDLSGSMEEAERAAEIMRGCVECRVPHLVDVEVGPSWGEVK